MTTISANLQAVRERIAAAARACRRDPAGIRLLAVSKTKPAADVLEAVAAGQSAFGENYVQEGMAKIDEIGKTGKIARHELEWHFIGPLQSNKTRLVAESFEWVHSIDRLKLAERLSAQRPESLPPLQVCLQVNISDEDSKSGLPADAIAELAKQVAQLPRLRLRGLMAIPAPTDSVDEQRQAFRQVRVLYEQLINDGLALDTLSMGMSHDLEAAIAEGATIVRIGSAIFGERSST